MQPMTARSMNDYPVPEGECLTVGHFYGMKLPEYQGDPVMFQPYSMFQHDLPEGYVMVEATGERSYQVVQYTPEPVDDSGKLNGLYPMSVQRESQDNLMRPQRSHGLGEPAVAPGISVQDSSKSGSDGLMNPAAQSGTQTPEPAAAAAGNEPAGGGSGSDEVPSGDLESELTGAKTSKKTSSRK